LRRVCNPTFDGVICGQMAGHRASQAPRAALTIAMSRQTRSAQEIQAEVHRLIHASREVRLDGAQVRVPLPVAIPVDGTGLNWWMTSFGDAVGYQRVIGEVVAEVGKRWNLSG
jgi:hypothetical protein